MQALVTISPAERRVLYYLKQTGPADVGTLARCLQVTPMAVRHHLTVLDKAGLVETTVERHGVGRPYYVYSLSAEAEDFFPKEYANLANNLIHAVARLDGRQKVAQLFEQMKQEAAVRYAPRMTSKSLRERVAETAKIQSESGYMADWEQLDARTFRIVERNCAISCVAQQYPQACECELDMLRQLLGAVVRRESYMGAGDACCGYLVQARRTGKSPASPKRLSSRVRSA